MFFVNLDYFYYLHEPNEEQHLYMSVYPYEVPMHLMPANSGKSGASSIIYKKELSRKIPGKGGCKVLVVQGWKKLIFLRILCGQGKKSNLVTVMLSQCYTPSKEKRRILYFTDLSKEFLEQMIPHLKALI